MTFTDSQTKLKNELNSGARKETPRPRSRSVYTTNSYVSDDSGGLYGKYEGSGWLPRQLSSKNLYLEEFSLNVIFSRRNKRAFLTTFFLFCLNKRTCGMTTRPFRTRPSHRMASLRCGCAIASASTSPLTGRSGSPI